MRVDTGGEGDAPRSPNILALSQRHSGPATKGAAEGKQSRRCNASSTSPEESNKVHVLNADLQQRVADCL